MKKCTYCGKEYPNDATVCELDQQPLISTDPRLQSPASGSAQPTASDPVDVTKASRVLGVVALAMLPQPFLLPVGLSPSVVAMVAALGAVITGHVASGRVRKAPPSQARVSSPRPGLIMGYLGLTLAAAFLFIYLPVNNATTRRLMERARCASNLRQIYVAFDDVKKHSDEIRYPFEFNSREGGTKDQIRLDSDGFDLRSSIHFQVLSNSEFPTKVLVCPSDSSKMAALGYSALQASNVSYVIRTGLTSSNHPREVFVRCPVHGTVLRFDGSVEQGGMR